MVSATVEMTVERAWELMEIINSYAYYDMGLVELPKKLPQDVSLLDLCRALEIAEANGEEKTESGTRIRCRPADRLIAAVFTASHYHVEGDSVQGIVRMPPGFFHPRGSVLCHLEIPEQGDSDGRQ